MTGPRTGTGAARRWLAPGVQAAALVVLLAVATQEVSGARADLGTGGQAARPVPVAVERSASRALPVRLDVPELGLRTRLIGLRKDRDGTLQVPADPQQTGWYSQGPTPGDPGSAVIVGHVDSVDGPGVFARLATMRPGHQIRVRRSDGGLAVFVVRSVRQVAKREFPTAEVYGDSGRPGLRLITCGGDFDRRSGSYRGNVVVYADLV